MAVDRNKIEIERIDNLTRNFGWVQIKQNITDTDIELTISKPRVEPIPEVGAGAN